MENSNNKGALPTSHECESHKSPPDNQKQKDIGLALKLALELKKEMEKEFGDE